MPKALARDLPCKCRDKRDHLLQASLGSEGSDFVETRHEDQVQSRAHSLVHGLRPRRSPTPLQPEVYQTSRLPRCEPILGTPPMPALIGASLETGGQRRSESENDQLPIASQDAGSAQSTRVIVAPTTDFRPRPDPHISSKPSKVGTPSSSD